MDSTYSRLKPFQGFLLRWPEKTVVEKTEKLEYDWLTLVANIGGALGLFLGFSFFMLWDLLSPCAVKIFRLIKYCNQRLNR